MLTEIQSKVFAKLMQKVGLKPDLSAYEKAFGIEPKKDSKQDFYNWFKNLGGDLGNNQDVCNALNIVQ